MSRELEKNIVFLHKPSLLSVVSAWWAIYRCKSVYLHTPATNGVRSRRRQLKIAQIILRFFFRNKPILFFERFRAAKIAFSVNLKAVQIVENAQEKLERSILYRALQHLGEKEGLICAIKAEWVVEVADYLTFLGIAEVLAKEGPVTLFAEDISFQLLELPKRAQLKKIFLPLRFLSNTAKTFFVFYIPTLFLLMKLPTLIKRRRQILRAQYDVALPVLYGMDGKNPVINGIRKAYADDYIYCDEIPRGRILHFFSDWRYPGHEESMMHSMMEQGIPCAHKNDFVLTFGLFWKIIFIQNRNLWGLIFSPFIAWRTPEVLIHAAGYLIYGLMRSWFEATNINSNVKFLRNDYSIYHITDTMVAHQMGRKTVGFQHGATGGPVTYPKLCYVYMDRYCIHGPKHRRLFHPFWEKINLSLVGSMTVEYVRQLSRNTSYIQTVREKIKNLYGEKSRRILITFPSSGALNLEHRWEEMYQALLQFRNTSCEAQIFFRFRNGKYFEDPKLKRFKELADSDDRFIDDHDNFDTYSLMLVSDLVITNSVSTSIIEAIAVGKRAFAFDFQDSTHYFFDEYGPQIVINCASELLEIMTSSAEQIESRYKIEWDRLVRDYDFMPEKGTKREIQLAVLQEMKCSLVGQPSQISFTIPPSVNAA